MGKLRLQLTQSFSLLFCVLQVGDINIGADIAREFSCARVSWNTALNHPSVFAIRPLEPIVHAKRFLGLECWQKTVKTELHIIRVYTLYPSQTDLLLHGSSREIQPRFAEIIAKSVRSRSPDHYWSFIGHGLEPSLA